MGDLIPDFVLDILIAKPGIGRSKLSELANIHDSDARFYLRIFKESLKVDHTSKGVALFDIHYPDHDKPSINAVFKFMEDFNPDHVIFGGDQLQFDTISVYNRSKPKLVEGKRLKSEYLGFDSEIKSPIETIISSDSKLYWLDGNHEDRIRRLIESDPQYEGFIEIENNLDLSKYQRTGLITCYSDNKRRRRAENIF